MILQIARFGYQNEKMDRRRESSLHLGYNLAVILNSETYLPIPAYLGTNFDKGGVVESETVNESVQQEETIKPRSFFSRLGNVYFSPGETFREIGLAPRVLVPIIAMIIISMAAGYYLSQKIDLTSLQAQQLEKMVAAGSLTKEQMEQQMAVISKIGGIELVIGAPISNLLVALIIAAVFKLISVVISAENRFKAIFSVTIYAMIAVSIVQSILLIVVLFFKSPGGVSVTSMNSVLASNLGALLSAVLGEDGLPKYVLRLARWIDIFSIWIIALLAIGYSAVSRKLKTSTAATWLGCLYAIVAVIGSALGSLFS